MTHPPCSDCPLSRSPSQPILLRRIIFTAVPPTHPRRLLWLRVKVRGTKAPSSQPQFFWPFLSAPLAENFSVGAMGSPGKNSALPLTLREGEGDLGRAGFPRWDPSKEQLAGSASAQRAAHLPVLLAGDSEPR